MTHFKSVGLTKVTFKTTALAAAIAGVSASVPTLAEEGFFLEEVVVTAQKRAQSTQDIGLSIAAVTGESLRDQGIDQAADLAKIIPNVSVQNVSGGGVPVVIIRGVGLQNFRINDTPTTAFYVDEVYQTSIASAEFSMFDLERVEVLKGPQGGLYGRNTIAGAIQILSNTPDVDEAANGYLKASYGSYAKKEFEGGVTVPLSDIAAARVSGRWVKSDDTYFESVTGDFDHGVEDRWGGRAIVRVTPSDNADFVFKVHGGEDNSDLPLLRSIGTHSGAFFTGPCGSIAAGNGSDPSACTTVNGQTPVELGLGQSDSDRFDSAATSDSFLENSWWGSSLIATFNVGDYTLTSISAYDEIDYRRVSDVDATPAEIQHIDYRSEIESWSQEFRLAYEGNNYNWVAGINYAEDELAEDTVLYGADLLPGIFAGADHSPQQYLQEAESTAAYVHAEWQFADQWNLVSELRHTDETRSFKGGSSAINSTNGAVILAVSTDDSARYDAFSGKFALEWMPTDNLMSYASYSRGFKTGGFFGGLATNVSQLEQFDSETNDAFELGVKSDWLDGTLRANASVFFYDRKDVQGSARDDSGGAVSIARLQNIGDVETSGAEMDLTWLPTRNLSLNLGVGYTDAEIVDSDLVQKDSLGNPQAFAMEGRNVANYSKWSLNFIGKYEQSVGDNLMASAQLEYSYRSERDLTQTVNSEEEAAVFREPGYDIINLRIGLGSEDGVWNVTGFVENLADESHRLLARSDGLFGVHELYGAPRTWGLSFTRNWD